MTDVQHIVSRQASRLDYRIDQDIGIARLHFAEPHEPPLVVTIPLSELQRLFESIRVQFAQEPQLFARVSKREKKS